MAQTKALHFAVDADPPSKTNKRLKSQFLGVRAIHSLSSVFPQEAVSEKKRTPEGLEVMGYDSEPLHTD